MAEPKIIYETATDRQQRLALERIRSAHAPAMLQKLKPMMVSRGLTAATLSNLTGITPARLKSLLHLNAMEEPFFDEAALLARALCTQGILPIMGGEGPLRGRAMGMAFPSDMGVYRSGARVPLSLACRVAVQLGLTDPLQLGRDNPLSDPLHRQIWQIMERSERSSDSGLCPWCRSSIGAGDPHLPSCLPDALWGENIPFTLLPGVTQPLTRKSGKRMPSAIGAGVKRVRTALGMTQRQFGKPAGIGESYIAQIEQRANSLTQRMAERIVAAHPGIPIAELFMPDTDPRCTIWPASYGPRPVTPPPAPPAPPLANLSGLPDSDPFARLARRVQESDGTDPFTGV